MFINSRDMFFLNFAKNGKKLETIAIISGTVTLRYGKLGIIVKAIELPIKKWTKIQGVPFNFKKLHITTVKWNTLYNVFFLHNVEFFVLCTLR